VDGTTFQEPRKEAQKVTKEKPAYETVGVSEFREGVKWRKKESLPSLRGLGRGENMIGRGRLILSLKKKNEETARRKLKKMKGKESLTLKKKGDQKPNVKTSQERDAAAPVWTD